MPETSSKGELIRDENEVSNEGKYEFQDIRNRNKLTRGSRHINLIRYELGLSSTGSKSSTESLVNGIRDLSRGLVIDPNNRFILILS